MDGASFTRNMDGFFNFIFAIMIFGALVTLGGIGALIALLCGSTLIAKISLGVGFISGGAIGTIKYLGKV